MNRRLRDFPRATWWFIGVPLPLSGCSGSGVVTGTVTFQNKAVTSGTVIIAGSDHLPYYGHINDDGTYPVPHVPTGFARIAVVSPGPVSADQLRSKLEALRPGFQPRAAAPKFHGDPQKWFPLPDKYREFDTSGLTVNVMGGVNPLNIELD